MKKYIPLTVLLILIIGITVGFLIIKPKHTSGVITPDPLNSNYNIFTSEKLGIKYRYPKAIVPAYPQNTTIPQEVYVREDAVTNRLYVGIGDSEKNPQLYYIEIIGKDSTTEFLTDVANKFIVDKKECGVFSSQQNASILYIDTLKSNSEPVDRGNCKKPDSGYFALPDAFNRSKGFTKYIFVKNSGQEPYWGGMVKTEDTFWPPQIGKNLEFISQ